jgi:hypothetical protein
VALNIKETVKGSSLNDLFGDEIKVVDSDGE